MTGICTVNVEWQKDDKGQWKMVEVPGSEKIFEADLVLLAMGFLGPEQAVIEQLKLEKESRSNILTPMGKYRTSVPKVFAAGGRFIKSNRTVIFTGRHAGLPGPEAGLILLDKTIDASVQIGMGPGPVIGPANFYLIGSGPDGACTDIFGPGPGPGPGPGIDDLTKQSVPVQ